MDSTELQKLHIAPALKRRPHAIFRAIVLLVVAALVGTAWLAFFGHNERRMALGVTSVANATETVSTNTPAPTPAANADTALTASGYIINRERIEISPRFMGVVKWMGVRKGDAVTNGQTVVLLDDAEYQAQLRQAQGRLTNALIAVDKAQLLYQRVTNLTHDAIETKQNEDDARLAVSAARALVREAEGSVALIQTYVDWTVIKSPINGIVMEKLASAGELVTPQSFGGTRGPSTALVAVADPKDLQVELDINETDLSKISLKQKCRVSPEAYLDKHYDGYVVEIAPEADRQKGTLQIKVQIANPDHFLTPELSAKVDFLVK
ncbi:MAG: hypothetical protein RLZZ350_2075 [Verrucomicrobiota bacterium]|jgi:HlyD family secretion protein